MRTRGKKVCGREPGQPSARIEFLPMAGRQKREENILLRKDLKMKKRRKKNANKRLRRQLNRALREVDTLKARLYSVSGDTSCVQAMPSEVSSTDKRYRIGCNDLFLFTYPSELRKIEQEVLRCDGIETGGMLFGHITRTDMMCVDLVTVASKRAKRGVTMFEGDPHDDEILSNSIIDGYGIEGFGSWHSHHRLGLAHPSAGDSVTMRRHFEQLPEAITKFVMMIATITGDNQVLINPYLFIRGIETPFKMHWLTPERVKDSPFSAILKNMNEVEV